MSTPPSLHPSALFEQAKELMKRRDYAAAATALRSAIAQDPTDHRYHAFLGHAITDNHDYWHNPEQCQRLLHNGVLDEAIGHWLKAIELGNSTDWALLGLGHAYTLKADHQKAAHFLRLATDEKLRHEKPDFVARHRQAGSRKGPDFIVIGATKCGTTSLYEYLCKHPQVLPAIWKEIEYFRFPERGGEWYLSHFPRIPEGPVRYVSGEASTCYMSIWQAKDRVYAEYPQAKLIALIRDPVDKAISHVYHDRKIGCEHRTMDEAINRELDLLEALDQPFYDTEEYWKTERGYVYLAMYAYMLENWLTRFPKEQLLVIPSEDLYRDPAGTVSKTLDFLGLPQHQLASYDVHLEGQYDKNSTGGPTRERLKRFFVPHNERLYQLLGRRLDWQKP